jgi:uncharacterized protein YprB with RNaseH-like and TPR domain
MIDHILKRGDVPKRKLAKMFNTTTHQALEAKKKAKIEKNFCMGPAFGYFDLETTGLRPEFGSIICCAVRTYPSGEWKIFSILDYETEGMYDDGELAKDIRDHLEQHHILVGWNSKGFDVPFINTRLAYWGHRKLRTHLHLDCMYYYRGWHGIKPTSSSLKSVGEYWRLPVHKQEVEKETWIKAGGGHKDSIKIIVDRAKSDVELTALITGKTFEAGLVKNIQRYA